MTSLRKESKATSLTSLPSEVMESMVHMLWSRDQVALTKTAKEPSIWVAKGLLYELIELLELNRDDIVMPMSLQEAKKMYMDLLRKQTPHMMNFLLKLRDASCSGKIGAQEDRYLKHLFHFCNANKKGGSLLVHAVTVLHASAADASAYRLANKFIAHGADVNWRDHDGNTLLHGIILSKRPVDLEIAERLETVRVLLQNGADITLKGKDGLSALELARKHNDTEVWELLMAYIMQRRRDTFHLR